jgi:hypothetical protein
MNEVNDLIDLQDEYASYMIKFCLWKPKWQKYSLAENFEWVSHSFIPCNQKKIPNAPGIYSFVINPSVTKHPQRYLCYIGKSENLQRRFDDYLREVKSTSGRPKIVRLLNKWEGYLEFSFTILEKNRLEDIENYLIETFSPPFNDQFPTQISKITGAF